MAHRIIKPSPDDDFYVSWSTIVDAPLCWGTRDEVLKFELEVDERKEQFARPVWETAFDRADDTGTSQPSGWDGWADKDKTMIFEQRGLLAREGLVAFLDTFDPTTGRFDLLYLTPFEDVEEVRYYKDEV